MEIRPVSKLKKGRAGGRKVKTGCLTCKIRRVKCDEARPTCLRCIKFGVVCDGYTRPAAGVNLQPPRNAVLKPKPANSQHPVPKVIPRVAILQAPVNRIFNNEQERRYFRMFCEKTALSLAGYFNNSLWTQLVLQACENNPPIKHAIIAIGALDKTLDATVHERTMPYSVIQSRISEGLTSHQFALQQYGKAIKQMKEILAAGTEDYRNALILCLLTVCFEALDGDMQSAVTQIRYGLKIIKEWGQCKKSGKFGSSKASEMSILGNTGLIHAFNRLDNDSIMIMDAEPVDFSPPPNVTAALQHIPKSFNDLDEARAVLELVIRDILHWIANAYAWGSRQEAVKRDNDGRSQIASKDKAASPNSFLQSFMEEREQHLQRFGQWRLAFQPLWLRSRTNAGRKEYAAATVLEIRFIAVFTCLRADHFKGEMSYDDYRDNFQQVLDLSAALLAQDKTIDTQRALFTFDDPIVSGLYNVILKCRDPTIRRQAISMLKNRPRRDGVMDSALMARIGTLQMNIEEEGREGKVIPEHARIRGIKTTYDMAAHTGHMKYLKMVPGSKGKFEVRHVDFAW